MKKPLLLSRDIEILEFAFIMPCIIMPKEFTVTPWVVYTVCSLLAIDMVRRTVFDCRSKKQKVKKMNLKKEETRKALRLAHKERRKETRCGLPELEILILGGLMADILFMVDYKEPLILIAGISLFFILSFRTFERRKDLI